MGDDVAYIDLPSLPIVPGNCRPAIDRALQYPRPVRRSASILSAVGKVAQRTPGQVAVTSTDRLVTYQDLWDAIGRTHQALSAVQCAPGDRVVVAGDREASLITAFLGLESCGATYVPVDPTWPVARLTALVRRIRPRCVLTTGEASRTEAVRRAAAEVGVAVLAVPQQGDAVSWPGAPANIPDSQPRYIIHTSGSTGAPKGATVTHLGVLNHVYALVDVLNLTSSDVVAFSASPTYVISIWQMLAVLCVGGRVAVIRDLDVRFGRRLAASIREADVTVVELVPTAISWLLDAAERAPDVAPFPRLRVLMSTGERLEPPLAARVLNLLPHIEFYNAYGASECSDDVAMHRVSVADLAAPHIPIGTPIANAVLYLLVAEGDAWRAARPGEIGELWIGGAPVGAGYVGDSELTRQSFYLDPFDPASATGRLYRTGDLALFSEGHARCVGRRDRQVKIAGVRVELDEIEATIGGLPGVFACAVVVQVGRSGPELVAHYAATADKSQGDVVKAARAVLPAGMLPRRWNRMSELPLNRSGKTDYRALAGGATPQPNPVDLSGLPVHRPC